MGLLEIFASRESLRQCGVLSPMSNVARVVHPPDVPIYLAIAGMYLDCISGVPLWRQSPRSVSPKNPENSYVPALIPTTY
jgi:hypothetical protein